MGVTIEWVRKQELVARVRQHGLPMTERVDPGGERHHMYVHDPDGHVWDLTSTLELEVEVAVGRLFPDRDGGDSTNAGAGMVAPGSPDGVSGHRRGSEPSAQATTGAATPVKSRHGAAAAGNPLVTSAALDVLAMDGATAADAAIAAAVVYAVVEPMNAGLGGDLHATVFEFDGSDTAGDRNAATRAPRGIPGARVAMAGGWMYALDASGRSPGGVTRAQFDAALNLQCGRNRGKGGAYAPLADIPSYCPLVRALECWCRVSMALQADAIHAWCRLLMSGDHGSRRCVGHV